MRVQDRLGGPGRSRREQDNGDIRRSEPARTDRDTLAAEQLTKGGRVRVRALGEVDDQCRIDLPEGTLDVGGAE